MDAIRVAVVGSAGSNGLIWTLNRGEYDRMCRRLKEFIRILAAENPKKDITLVSGGSSLSDHTAVTLFLAGIPKRLELFLPSDFDTSTNSFKGHKDARSLNAHHSDFSKAFRMDSLAEIGAAIASVGCMVHTRNKGFSARNKDLVRSKVDYCIAFGFDRHEKLIVEPGDRLDWTPSGRTGPTWRLLRSMNVPLVFEPIKRN